MRAKGFGFGLLATIGLRRTIGFFAANDGFFAAIGFFAANDGFFAATGFLTSGFALAANSGFFVATGFFATTFGLGFALGLGFAATFLGNTNVGFFFFCVPDPASMYPRTAAFLSSAAGPPKLNTALVCHRARPSSVHGLIERARPSHHRVSAFVPPRPRPIRPTESTHSRFARPPRPRRTIERVRVLARASPPHRAHHHAPRASRDALARRARSSRERIRRPRASDDSHRTRRRRRRRRRHRLASVRVASVEISSLARSSIVGRREKSDVVDASRRRVDDRRSNRIESNASRPRGRSVGRSIDVRVVEKYIDASSIDFRIDRRVVDRFESTSSIDARARSQIIARGTIATTTTPRAARIRRRARAMAKKNVKAGMKARKDALVDMQTVSARQTTVRERADPYGKPLVGDDDE